MSDDDVRLGVVRPSMKHNVLLNKSGKVGVAVHTDTPRAVTEMVHGVKSGHGGTTAESLSDWRPSSGDTRGSGSNVLLRKPQLGRARVADVPVNEEMTFGIKSAGNEGGVATTMAATGAGPAKATRQDEQAPLGHHRPTYVKDADSRVFGIKSHGNDGGVAGSFVAAPEGDLPSERKAPLGHTRPTYIKDPEKRVFGVKSLGNDGGVAATFSMPVSDSPLHNVAPVGKARTTTVPNAETTTFGISTSKRDDSAGDVLSSWASKCDSPKQKRAQKPPTAPADGRTFGAPSGARDTNVSDLLANRFAHEFIEEQLHKQQRTPSGTSRPGSKPASASPQKRAPSSGSRAGTAASHKPDTADANKWVRPESSSNAHH